MKPLKRTLRWQHIYLLCGVLLLVGALNLFLLSEAGTDVGGAPALARQQVRITLLEDPACPACPDMNESVTRVKQQFDVRDEQRVAYKDAAELLSAYSISRVPALVLESDESLSPQGLGGFERRGGALVLEADAPPYTNVSTGVITGSVTALVLQDASCAVCQSLDQVLSQLRQLGVLISSERRVELDSQEGERLKRDYSIRRVPALILSKDFSAYGSATEKMWLQVGTKTEDGSYVLEEPNPPYVDVASGSVQGLVTMTVLSDDSCGACYDTEAFNLPILQRFGLVPTETTRVDVGSPEGEELVRTYAVTKVPTILLSSEAARYGSLTQAWKEVGTIEDDGTYVFRKTEVAGLPYKDLTKGSVVDPKRERAPQQDGPVNETEPKEFTIEAKQWEFIPSTLTVKQGDLVRLKITSTDVTHGFSLPEFNVNENLEPGRTVTVEFVADKKGTFSFACSVYCGAGHGSMVGQLVVQ